MDSSLVVSSSNSPLLAGIIVGILLTIVGVILSVTVDFLFGRRGDREHILGMGIICMVFAVTRAYFDTEKWFDILQGLLTITITSFLFQYLKMKYVSVYKYLEFTVWDFTGE